MINFKVECDCCNKIIEFKLSEENLIENEFIQVTQLGYEKIHLCKKCEHFLTSNPSQDEQLVDNVIPAIIDVLQDYSISKSIRLIQLKE